MNKEFKGITFNVEELTVNGSKCKSKSDLFKTLYDNGLEICEISRETGSHYSFVYGVISNAREIHPVKRETKSDVIRSLHQQGLSCTEIAKQTNSHYSFVYGVIKRMKESDEEVETSGTENDQPELTQEEVEAIEVKSYVKHKKNGQIYEVVEKGETWTLSEADGTEKTVKESTIKRYYEEYTE